MKDRQTNFMEEYKKGRTISLFKNTIRVFSLFQSNAYWLGVSLLWDTFVKKANNSTFVFFH